ncbi:MAG: DNA replication and repair protein RecF, partial [Gammaproteobacteria bacterium]|nr:DNA replication and repair protein RecF [Gammaproteobacteria bacterium]
MAITELQIERFRCLDSVALELSTEENLIIGPNASGKTSLLEAVYFLGHGRSFRGTPSRKLIQDGMDEFLVIAKLSQPDGRIGIQATRSAVTVKIDGTRAHTRSSLAARLPVQVIEPGIHKLIEEGPAQRRRYLDWGVFHVEQEFYSTWRRYRKSLDQRNALLKTNAAAAVASSWEETLIAAGDSVQKQRLRYLKKLAPYLEEAGNALFGAPLECRFHRGWPDDQTLAETMMANRQRDQQQAYTHAGPHRADIRIRLNQKIARARVSRGQQKLLASGLV